MKPINKHELEIEKTYKYFKESIKSNNTLSEEVLKRIDFSKGSFFTLLPDIAAVDRIYDFSGSILPLRGKMKDSRFANTWEIETTDQEMSEFILNFLEKEENSSAFFEDLLRDSSSPHIKNLSSDVFFFGDKVYYHVNSKNNKKAVLESLKKSNHLWHFLAVLTSNVGKIGPILKESDLRMICDRAKFVIAGAYDGEGYIIWERQEPIEQNK